MAEFDLQVITSREELRTHAAAWDQLWRRSRVTVPTAQAEPLAIWLEAFAKDAKFRALVVREGDQMVASLPLVEQSLGRALRVGGLPNNDYALSGDLALDPQCDREQALALLVEALHKQPWGLLWMNGINIDSPDWQMFHAASRKTGLFAQFHPLWQVGIIDVPHDWKLYMASRSKNLRHQMKRNVERLKAAGGGELNVVSNLNPREVEAHLRRGFEVEARGWKSLNGTSVLQSPGVFEFFCRQAAALAASGNLELVFLEHAGQPIAFEYGLRGKGVYFSPKVGYDEKYSALSPGQQLRYQLLEGFQQDPNRIAVDFHGPLAEATAKWATRSYHLGRLAIAVRGITSRAVCHGFTVARPTLRAIRHRLKKNPKPSFELYPLTPRREKPPKSKANPEAVEVTSS